MTDLKTLKTEMFNLRDELAEARYQNREYPTHEGRERVEELRKKLIAAERAVMKAGGAV
jgi:ribosomal protein L29